MATSGIGGYGPLGGTWFGGFVCQRSTWTTTPLGSSISRTAEATRGRSIQWNDWAKLMTRKAPRDPGRSWAGIWIQLALVMCSSSPSTPGLSQHSGIGVESNDALEEGGEEQRRRSLARNRRRGGDRFHRGGGGLRERRREPGHMVYDLAGSRRRCPRTPSRPRPSPPTDGTSVPPPSAQCGRPFMGLVNERYRAGRVGRLAVTPRVRTRNPPRIRRLKAGRQDPASQHLPH